MFKKAIKTALLAALFLPALSPVLSYGQTPDLPPAIKAFADRYIAALHTHDAAGMKALVAPKSVACIEKVSSIWFDQQAHFLSDKEMEGDLGMAVDNFSLPIPPNVSLPDKPQKLLTLSWKTGTDLKGGTASVQLGLIETGAGVFQTLPCPTEDDIKKRDAFFKRRGYKPGSAAGLKS